MRCPHCGAAELVHDTRDMPYTYKGETTVIPAVTGEFCTACDESILGLAETGRSMGLTLEFNNQVNAAIEQRLDQLAVQAGRSKAYYLRELVTKGLDDLEDYCLAAATVERVRKGESVYSAVQVRAELGLDI